MNTPDVTTEPFGVIFDMDGVLVDSAEAHLRSWQLLAAENGRSVSQEQFAASFGRQNRDIVPLFFGEVSDARLQFLSNRKEEIYRDLIRRNPPVARGVQALLAELSAAGLRLAIGSSGPLSNIELILEVLQARPLFPVIVSAEDVLRGKPDPQVFTQAAQRLGLPSTRCAVIEDAPVGIEAARAAGAIAVAVLSTHPAQAFASADSRKVPHLVVNHLAELSATRLVALLASHGQR